MLNWLMGQKKPEASAVAESAGAATEAEGSAEVAEATPEAPQDVQPLSIRKTCNPIAEASDPLESQLSELVQRRIDDCEKEIASPGFDLPTLPAVAMRLMEVMQNVNCPITKISETVMTDPVMAAKFLRMANSALYGGKSRIESVQTAVVRLGLGTVKNVVMSIALNGTILKDKRMEQTAKHLWEHSIGCAVAAREVARIIGGNPESAFMAGLLHDIGKVPALLFVQKSLKPNMKVRPEFIDALVEQHHIRAGIALQSQWQLPVDARLAMAAHHAVNSKSDAEAQVSLRIPQAEAEERKNLRDVLISVVLADRALASLGYAEEPGEVYIVDGQLAADVDLSPLSAMEYLQGLPDQVGKGTSML
ncbi:MAG: HDOD domain-containing protein [Planctomycetota bacterium]|nr:HDOD domain-containing protein [Planctomycetota bacterium]